MNNKEQTEDFRRLNEDLAALARHLISSQDYERERLARKLQESVTQALAALKYKLEYGEVLARQWRLSNPQDLLQGANTALQETLREVQELAMNIHPFILTDIGAVSAISALCRRFCERHPSIEICEEISIQDDAIPHRLKSAIFRSAEQYLDAVDARAFACRIQLSLSRTAEELLLELIEEDRLLGPPLIDPSAQQGLLSLRVRAEMTGGVFCQMSGKDGFGSHTCIRWPLVAAEAIQKSAT
jgi:two-component system, NarL family, sensor kinase